jgi:hypothetical protein
MANKKGKHTTMFDEDEVKDLAGRYLYWKGIAIGAMVVAITFCTLIAWASYLVN